MTPAQIEQTVLAIQASDMQHGMSLLTSLLMPPTKTKAVRRKGLDIAVKDTATMTDTEVRVYYKARQHYDDALFLARHSTLEDIRRAAWALTARIEEEGQKADHPKAVAHLRTQARTLQLQRDCLTAAARPREEYETDKVMVWRDGDSGGHTVRNIPRAERNAFVKAGWHCYGHARQEAASS